MEVPRRGLYNYNDQRTWLSGATAITATDHRGTCYSPWTGRLGMAGCSNMALALCATNHHVRRFDRHFSRGRQYTVQQGWTSNQITIRSIRSGKGRGTWFAGPVGNLKSTHGFQRKCVVRACSRNQEPQYYLLLVDGPPPASLASDSASSWSSPTQHPLHDKAYQTRGRGGPRGTARLCVPQVSASSRTGVVALAGPPPSMPPSPPHIDAGSRRIHARPH